MIKWSLILISLVFVLFLVKPFAHQIQNFLKNTAKGTVKVLSQTVGTPMKKDQYGNVNVLFVGYGGAGHGGGYLADSTIVASRNPNSGAVTMISIPRDMYVKNPLWWAGRINTIFTQLYGRTKDLKEAGSWYARELEKITGLEIPYYATIDFWGFQKVIDDLGGIEIDVPYSLHDYQYPDENLKGFDPLHVEQGLQHMDGKLALKYARSRHAAGHASDFDRSFRQQLVINAIKDKLLSWGNLTIARATELYESYTAMVNTNISLNEMLWTVQYLGTIKMFPQGLNSHYSYDSFKNAKMGSFLYNGDRELFNGAAVLVPFWASAGNLTKYDTLHQYVDFVAHLQGFLIDNAKIQVDNGIDKELLRQQGLQNVRIAGRLATKMKRFWMNIVESSNTEPQTLTTLTINTEATEAKGFENTITAIKNFAPIDQIIYNTGMVKTIIDDYGNEVEIFTWADIQLILGASYLSGLQLQKFKPEELIIQYR